jgi:hypothetical protein
MLLVPIPTFPDESILIDSTPPSEKAIVSAPGLNMPVLVSPVNVMDGVDALPAANSMVCAPPVTTTVPVEVGKVSV